MCTETDGEGCLFSLLCPYTYDANTDDITSAKATADGQTVSNSYGYSNDKLTSIMHNGFNYAFGYDFNGDNQLSKLSMGLGDNLYLAYDGLNRLATKQFTFGNGKLTTEYSYLAGANGNTSTLVSGYKITKNTGGTDTSLHNYGYAYDKNGNITTISENGTQKATYQYNELNELKWEDNANLNKSIVYAYDAGGNLLSKTEYPYSTGTLGTATATHTYTYGDGNWKDKLTSYDGNAITYDAIGNPLSYYNGWNFGWEEGNQLATAKNGSTNISYKYNSDGIRTQKTVNGVTTTYCLEDGDVTWEQSGSDTIHYTYDKDGNLVYMVLNGALYYYERNAQNDIIGLVDSNMNEVVTYTYDSWGKLLNVGGSLASTVGQKNPYRYRGYRYDSETSLYLLQSRYYDPNTGRFLNADDTDVLDGSTEHLQENNLFIYCFNNPVNMTDEGGNFALLLPFAAFIPGLGIVVGIAAIAVVAYVGFSYLNHVNQVNQSQQAVNLAKKRNKPKGEGTPNSSELHKGQDGDLDGYTTYGPDGRTKKQVRLKGKPHGKIKRPNVKQRKTRTDPEGGKHEYWKVRRARKWELPKGYK